MNFLAHLYLSDRTPASLLGALCGDFMKGYRVEHFSTEIQRGIRLHQYIDTVTDDHPIFRQSKRRISLERRRYAGVLVDIFYDHFLAIDWPIYSSQPLEAFTQNVYRVLEGHCDQLPHRLQTITPKLVAEDWLTTYRTLGGLDQTFQRLSRRIQRTNTVDRALRDLQANRYELYQDFCLFFPDLQEAVHHFEYS